MDDLKNNEEFQRAMAEARRQWEEENRQKGGGLLNFVNQQPTVVKIIMFLGVIVVIVEGVSIIVSSGRHGRLADALCSKVEDLGNKAQ